MKKKNSTNFIPFKVDVLSLYKTFSFDQGGTSILLLDWMHKGKIREIISNYNFHHRHT